jgi:phage terminase large subunit-like protein
MPSEWIRNPSDELAVSQGCTFDPSHGARVCAFVERFCRQSKGRWAGEPIRLVDWQRDLIMRAFGWRKSDGKRRFKTVHVELPKKNGKSTLVSALALYLQLQDGENAAEVYLNAVDRKQADIVFEEACRMIESSPQFGSRLVISRYHGTVTDPRKYGVIQKNSGDAPSKDGANASAVIFDEIHRFGDDRRMWDIYTYAGISREQPIKIVITTAGEDAEGVWWELREHTEAVIAGTRPDTTHLGVVYRARTEADPGGADDLDDPATWERANPSMGHTMTLEDFRADFEAARTKGGAEWANFLRLRLGIVMRAEGKFVQLAEWDACNGYHEPHCDSPCYMGLDLSSHDDLTALVLITGDLEAGFAVQCRFWLPSDNIVDLERHHGQPYRVWAERGYIRLIDGPVISNAFVEKDVVEIAQGRGNLRSILCDPWNGFDLSQRLLNDHGLPVAYLQQGFRSLTDPTKRLKDLIVGKLLRHGGHPILRWHAGAIADPEGTGSGASVYDTRGLLTL